MFSPYKDCKAILISRIVCDLIQQWLSKDFLNIFYFPKSLNKTHLIPHLHVEKLVCVEATFLFLQHLTLFFCSFLRDVDEFWQLFAVGSLMCGPCEELNDIAAKQLRVHSRQKVAWQCMCPA